ncbi:hypothetical protein PCL_05201 [Purpureocillium lilacinum]|uniref:Uncharacterized protein n=1 Tax=Purpureocillium lilacinum TaxID=33203 RepID=A0A2U3DVF7_PURLI|nr:hypothetical protein PCL_05201 [Purpureocillium lilacinum]
MRSPQPAEPEKTIAQSSPELLDSSGWGGPWWTLLLSSPASLAEAAAVVDSVPAWRIVSPTRSDSAPGALSPVPVLPARAPQSLAASHQHGYMHFGCGIDLTADQTDHITDDVREKTPGETRSRRHSGAR